MFQYAALYGISKANGFRPLVCGTTVVGRVFRGLRARRLDAEVVSTTRSYGVYVERKSAAFDSRALSLNFMRNIVLDGFFQSWRYRHHIWVCSFRLAAQLSGSDAFKDSTCNTEAKDFTYKATGNKIKINQQSIHLQWL